MHKRSTSVARRLQTRYPRASGSIDPFYLTQPIPLASIRSRWIPYAHIRPDRMVRPLGETEAEADDAEPPPVPDAMLPFLGHPYHAYVSPRIPPAAGDGDQEQQQDLLPGLDGMEADKKPLRQLRAYLQRLEAQAARPWWRLRSASYLLLVLVGVCYLGGRSLLLRWVGSF